MFQGLYVDVLSRCLRIGSLGVKGLGLKVKEL